MRSTGKNGGCHWFLRYLLLRGVYNSFTTVGFMQCCLRRPAHLSHKMHFRNVPCSVEPDNPRNPLNILRRLYKPGDYVAFKLVSQECCFQSGQGSNHMWFLYVHAVQL